MSKQDKRTLRSWLLEHVGELIFSILGAVIIAFIVQEGGRFGPAEQSVVAVPPENIEASPSPTESSTPAPTMGREVSDSTVPPATNTANQPLATASRETSWTRLVDDMPMVFVPDGTFQMGSGPGDIDAVLATCPGESGECQREAFLDETPQHRVELDSFWIDQTEVTNRQYSVFLNEQEEVNLPEDTVAWLDINSEHSGIEWRDGAFQPIPGFDDRPIVEVSWHGANAYCRWAGGMLPTEAQWEYAARGPNGSIFPWGDAFDVQLANFCDVRCSFSWNASEFDDGFSETAVVGSYSDGSSLFGVLDMAGNVYEWVADWYQPDYYAESPTVNPQGPMTGNTRVARGGAWHSSLQFLRNAFRNNKNPGFYDEFTGFRCAVAD